MLKDIKRLELSIRELKKPIKAGGEEKIITFDLYEIFNSRRSFMDKITDKASSLGFKGLLGKKENDDRASLKKLVEMARYSKDWIKASNHLQKIKIQTTKLSEQLDRFVLENKTLSKMKANLPQGNKIYQPILDEHILDCLEMAAISCEISHLIDLANDNKLQN